MDSLNPENGRNREFLSYFRLGLEKVRMVSDVSGQLTLILDTCHFAESVDGISDFLT